MAEELERTCENCRYEHEDMESTHCRHCIHNATENFEPKVKCNTEREIREKAIDEYFNKLCNASESIRPVGWTGRYCIVTIDNAKEIAEQMKAGAENERL